MTTEIYWKQEKDSRGHLAFILFVNKQQTNFMYIIDKNINKVYAPVFNQQIMSANDSQDIPLLKYVLLESYMASKEGKRNWK